MAVHDFRSQRLFVNHPLKKDVNFEVAREQANYLLNVMRLKTDDEILIFNGKDGEWRVRVEEMGRKKCKLHSLEQMRSQPENPDLIYCFAPLKQARLDYMVQKAVEMGAGVLQPVITQYTQVRSLNEKRLAANSVEAAEQCGIISLPEIREPLPLVKLLENLGDETHLIFCDEEAHSLNSIEHLKSLGSKNLALLIGPEGGFSNEEREYLAEHKNVTKLGLGPRILRADTAAVAALAIIQAHLGDWYE